MRGLFLLLAVLVIPGFMFSVSAGSSSTPLDLPAQGLSQDEDDAIGATCFAGTKERPTLRQWMTQVGSVNRAWTWIFVVEEHGQPRL